MIPRNHVGKGVTGAVRYVLGEGRDRATGQPRTEPKGEQSRVAWISGTGFGFAIESRDDADLARKVMEFTALNQGSKTKPCEKDCVHLSLGWRQGEQPSREQMIEAAHGALAALGMANARAIFVSHDDEQYPHLHIVASKINPDTGRAYDLKGDRLKLSAWAEKYERAFSGGIICTRREETNQLRAAIDRRDTAAVLDLMVQQRATFTARDLDRVLGKQIKRPLQRAQFAGDILAQADAVRLTDPARPEAVRFTTRAVLEAEGQVLRAANALVAADRHAVSARLRKAVLESPQFDGITREQATAFRRCVESGGLALIDGQAGTGKSYTISAIRQAYERAGYSVIGLGPTNAVAGDMRDSGFVRAGTIHSELFRLKNGRAVWTDRTAIILDEAAMIDTKLMAQVVQRAAEAGAKLIMLGDDRQLSSIDRGGMFGVLKDRHGAAELTQVRRQHKNDDRRAAELMAEGNFSTALGMYDTKGAIHWERSQDDAREALIEQWAKDTRAEPAKSRFVFAYTNADVDRLNAELRAVRLARGELPEPATRFTTKHGPADFSAGDRIQITGTDKERGLFNGAAGTVTAIDGTMLAFRLDGRDSRVVEFDTRAFPDFRHGYAGTIYKGQGRTLDQTYLYHSEHWRSASSYVALTRHRDKTELFVATNTAADLKTLARQMARVDDRRAASAFYRQGPIEPVRPVSSQDLQPIELPARRVVGSSTMRSDPPAGSDVPQQGEGVPAAQAPRRRRERPEVGRDGAGARPEGRAGDHRTAPATGASAISLPPANEQRQPMAEPEPPRKARRERAEVGRNNPLPAVSRDAGQPPGPSVTATPTSPEIETDEQRSRSAVAGWTDQGGMVPQQDSAREAVREVTELHHRTPAPTPRDPAEMSPTPTAEPPQVRATAPGTATRADGPSPAEPAARPAAHTQPQPDAAQAADAANAPDARRAQTASQAASSPRGDTPLSPRDTAGSKAEAPSEAQSWQAAARELYETVRQRAAEERGGRPANSPGRSGPSQGRGR